ncbi:HAD family hydrolase [Pectobacterium aroidearum]|uniref:HAD family hydrolase n=1 Tax=Pectobacterium aroidearum TaxID=1201031 RepID=UPI00301A5FEE
MKDSTAIKHVIFDWNGTLVDDLALAVKGLNAVRELQTLPPLDAKRYREHFGFPIQSFYQAVGIDCESGRFDDLIHTYLSIFNSEINQCPLHQGAVDIISMLRRTGVSISVLSASQHETLQNNLASAGIDHLVDHAFGLTNTQAKGKQGIAEELDSVLGNPGTAALMIGDTDHDIDVAHACGWQMASVSHGHQTHERLSAIHPFVFGDLSSVYRAYFR